jgi:short-subunit dehydrogenase
MWSNETRDLPLRVNLFDPGPTQTSMRDNIPDTDGKSSNLARPEDVARKALHAVAPNLDRTGQIYYQASFDRWVRRQRPN